MKKLIIVLIIAALAGGGWYSYKQSSQKAAPTVQNRQDKGIQKVKRRSIQLSITAAGDISPAE